MPRSSLDRLVEDKLAEQTDDGERFVDMRMQLVDEKTGKSLLEGGGRWDRALKRYVEPTPARARILRFHPGQREALEFWRDWYRKHRAAAHVAAGRPFPSGAPVGRLCTKSGLEIWSAGLVGGRRGGKSDAAVKFGAFYATAIPGSIVWFVIPVEEDAPELIRALKPCFPKEWYSYNETDMVFTLVNGATIEIRSSHDPEALRRGRCDLAIVNEAQKQRKRTYTVLRPATADRGGLTLIVANPPDEGSRGWWVDDWVHKARAEKIGARVIELDPSKNPWVTYASLKALEGELGAREFQRDILGKFLPRDDRVFYEFSDDNVRAPIDAKGVPLVDVTQEFTKKKLGRPFSAVLGMDFQMVPHQVAIEVRWFAEPCDLCAGVHPWIVSETLVESGTEEDLIDEIEAKGLDPATTAVIPDATGDYQGSERIKGRASWDILRKRGWANLYYPDEKMKRDGTASVRTNPEVRDRVAGFNLRLRTADERHHVFVVPTATSTREALERWERDKFGKPDKRSKFAHVGDAATYPFWRFYPRRAPPSAVSYTPVERVPHERERALEKF
jgi:hypothetical protein